MDSGWLVQDQAVLAYMKKLEAHKYANCHQPAVFMLYMHKYEGVDSQ